MLPGGTQGLSKSVSDNIPNTLHNYPYITFQPAGREHSPSTISPAPKVFGIFRNKDLPSGSDSQPTAVAISYLVCGALGTP